MKERINQNKDVAESARVGRKVRAKVSQCFLNAWRVIQHVPDYANADYVEGLAVCKSGLCIEHGWVEKDGVIVDPTIHTDDMVYYPGLRFKGQRGQAEALRIPKPERTDDELPIFYRFGWGGIDSLEFRAALIAAYRFMGAEELARRYENYKPIQSEPECELTAEEESSVRQIIEQAKGRYLKSPTYVEMDNGDLTERDEKQIHADWWNKLTGDVDDESPCWQLYYHAIEGECCDLLGGTDYSPDFIMNVLNRLLEEYRIPGAEVQEEMVGTV